MALLLRIVHPAEEGISLRADVVIDTKRFLVFVEPVGILERDTHGIGCVGGLHVACAVRGAQQLGKRSSLAAKLRWRDDIARIRSTADDFAAIVSHNRSG